MRVGFSQLSLSSQVTNSRQLTKGVTAWRAWSQGVLQGKRLGKEPDSTTIAEWDPLPDLDQNEIEQEIIVNF